MDLVQDPLSSPEMCMAAVERLAEACSVVPLLLGIAAPCVAARGVGLDRGTWNRPIGTEHTAVARLWSKHRPTARAVIEVNACVGRH